MLVPGLLVVGYNRSVSKIGQARLAILVGHRGRGSNMANLIRQSRAGKLHAAVGVVVSTGRDSPALAIADAEHVATRIVPTTAPDYERMLLDALKEHRVDLVCLAGYMRLLPQNILDAYPHRVLNIHPALLPKFGGQGMYGAHLHRAVLDSGDTESGCTVHLVNERYDEGPIIHQLRCPVLPDDTPETLAARVLELEHEAYVVAINHVIDHFSLAH